MPGMRMSPWGVKKKKIKKMMFQKFIDLKMSSGWERRKKRGRERCKRKGERENGRKTKRWKTGRD